MTFCVFRLEGWCSLRNLSVGAILMGVLGTPSHANQWEDSTWFDGIEAYPIVIRPDWTTTTPSEDALSLTPPNPSVGLGIRLPRPFTFSRTLNNGSWQVDGVGFEAAPDIEIRATGGINSASDDVQADLSLRFRF